MRKFYLISIFLCSLLLVSGAEEKLIPTGKIIRDTDPENLSKSGAPFRSANEYEGVFPVKTIAIITPASYPGSKVNRIGLELLQNASYNVKVLPHVFDKPDPKMMAASENYSAIPVELRLEDFYQAWNDPDVGMIICARGDPDRWSGSDILDVDNRLIRYGDDLRGSGTRSKNESGIAGRHDSGGPVYYIRRAFPGNLGVFLAVVLIFCGTLMKSDLVWELQDLLNQLMVLPNVAALIALSKVVAAASRN